MYVKIKGYVITILYSHVEDVKSHDQRLCNYCTLMSEMSEI